jgi:hypothetical protein
MQDAVTALGQRLHVGEFAQRGRSFGLAVLGFKTKSFRVAVNTCYGFSVLPNVPCLCPLKTPWGKKNPRCANWCPTRSGAT